MLIDWGKFASIVRVLLNHVQKSTLLFRHACAVINGGKIKSIGINTNSNVPLHAEINAIKNFKKKNGSDLRRTTLVVLRIYNGKLGESKPCSCCINYIKDHHIKQVTYSCAEGSFKTEKLCDITSSHETLFFRMNKLVFDGLPAGASLFKRYNLKSNGVQVSAKVHDRSCENRGVQ